MGRGYIFKVEYGVQCFSLLFSAMKAGAQLHQLNPAQTLDLFGNFYQDVLNDPEGDSHQNILMTILSPKPLLKVVGVYW
jgi:hypothetical protein